MLHQSDVGVRGAAVQVTKASVDTSSLVAAVYLVNSGASCWLGGYRTGTVSAAGWSWVDGTPPTNLNCGAASCGPWESLQPE